MPFFLRSVRSHISEIRTLTGNERLPFSASEILGLIKLRFCFSLPLFCNFFYALFPFSSLCLTLAGSKRQNVWKIPLLIKLIRFFLTLFLFHFFHVSSLRFTFFFFLSRNSNSTLFIFNIYQLLSFRLIFSSSFLYTQFIYTFLPFISSFIFFYLSSLNRHLPLFWIFPNLLDSN